MKTNSKIDKMLSTFSHRKPYVIDDGPLRIGLKVPQVRSFVKKNFKYLENKSEHFLQFWDSTWKSSVYFESMSAALYFYQNRSLQEKEFKKIIKWADRCQCWEHSDDLSKIYAQVVEDKPKIILPQLTKWNQSKNPWKRRQSVVSLIEYSRKRKTVLPFKKLISFVKPLLSDEEYYVQKGVGWTIREIYNVYPKEMLEFFDRNLLAINPLAYSAATEKLDKKTKLQFNKLRKQRAH